MPRSLGYRVRPRSISSITRPVIAAKTSAPEAPNTKKPRSTSMPNAHVTVQPTGQVIATTSGHSLARRSRPRKASPHCSSPTATPVARPVMSRAPIPVPAPVSNAPMASPIATPKVVASTHSGPTLMYLLSTNHWAAPITAPARAPPSAPDTNPSIEPTTTRANNPPSGKPRKASIHHKKKRQLPVLGSWLSVTVCIVPRSTFVFVDTVASPCSRPGTGRMWLEVAGPGLEGGQVAVPRLYAHSSYQRNSYSILFSEGTVCTTEHIVSCDPSPSTPSCYNRYAARNSLISD